MTDTVITVTLLEHVAREVERLARERGETPADFVADAAAAKVADYETAVAYFRERAARAKPGAAAAFFNREGGEPPRPGDEVD